MLHSSSLDSCQIARDLAEVAWSLPGNPAEDISLPRLHWNKFIKHLAYDPAHAIFRFPRFLNVEDICDHQDSANDQRCTSQ